MIAFDFVYCRPDTLQEAVEVYAQLDTEGRRPVYFAGGSETITLCRAGSIQPGAVIDIKNIPECTVLSMKGPALRIGAACTLNRIKESRLYLLLRLACGRIADHTNQCRITLGGNIGGTIIYREASLPLLLCDADITLYGPQGLRTVPFGSVFDQRIRLQPGELMVQLHVPKWALQARHAHVKRTQNDKIDYPLLSLAALWQEDVLRMAFSGVCSYPFRSASIEAVLNDRTASCTARAQKTVSLLPESAYSDVEGTGAYRSFMFKNTVQSLLEDWQNGKI